MQDGPDDRVIWFHASDGHYSTKWDIRGWSSGKLDAVRIGAFGDPLEAENSSQV